MSSADDVRRLVSAQNQVLRAVEGVHGSSLVGRVARAEAVLDRLVDGANAGPQGFREAVEQVQRWLHQPNAAEIAALARAVAPSTRTRYEHIAAVLEARVAGASWAGAVAAAPGYYSDTTAKRWGELAARSQPRFAAALRVAVDGQSNGGEAGESSVVPSN